MIKKKLMCAEFQLQIEQKASIYNNDTKNLHINKMKTIDHQPKINSTHNFNDPSFKISTACNHKIDLLLRRQNCHLPSVQCKEKCSHKHLKRQHYDQHQYSTENELRKFMTNKIEHKNKAFMMEKEIIKEEILRQINNAEQMLKTMKQNVMKQIDGLYYGAVKSGNDELTAKGMDKFFSSQLESLTCHQVYCLFSFKPLIEEKINSKIFSSLRFVKQQVNDMRKSIEKTKTSITQRIHMIQTGQQSQMIPEKEIQPQKEKINNQKPEQKKNIEKMDEEIQQKKSLQKIIAINLTISPTPKQPILPQKAQSKSTENVQVLSRKQQKQLKKDNQKARKEENQIGRGQSIVRKEQQYPRKEQTQSRIKQMQIRNGEKYLGKQEKQVIKNPQQVRIEEKLARKQEKQINKPPKQQTRQKQVLQGQLPKPIEKQPNQPKQSLKQADKPPKSSPSNQQKKTTHIPAVSEDKSSKPQATQKNIEKPMVKEAPKPPIKENTFKPSEYLKYTQRMSNNNSLLEKCKMFQNYSQQSSKTKEENLRSQNQMIKPTNDLKKNTNEPTKPINQKQIPYKPKITPEDQPFQILWNNFKAMGSVDKMFSNNDSKKEVLKISEKPQQQISKVITQNNPISSQPTIQKKQQLSFKKEIRIGTDEQSIKKNIFSDLKRTSESFKEKWINEGHPEGRKIVKIENQFPHSSLQTDSPNLKKPNNEESKMIPEPVVLPDKKQTQIHKTKDFFQSNSETKTLTSNGVTQTKKIQITEPKQKPIEKALTRKEQTRPQHILTASDKILLELVRQSGQTQIQQPKSTKMDLELQNQSSVQTPTFKATSNEKNSDKLNLDNPIKQTKKQFQTPEKLKQEIKNHQGSSNDALAEPKKTDQKEQTQNPISFLPKPSIKKVQQETMELTSPQKPVTQRQTTPVQTFDSGVKKIRLQNPGSRPFGRVSQNPIYNFVELFQRGQQGLKQLQQKKQEKRQEYNKNSLLGEMERTNGNSKSYGLEGLKQNDATAKQSSAPIEQKSNVSNTNGQESSKPISLDENKSSQKKLNYNSNYYDSRLPSWFTQRK